MPPDNRPHPDARNPAVRSSEATGTRAGGRERQTALEPGVTTLPSVPECKQEPGVFRPVIDRSRCEGKAECVRVCPTAVFVVGTLPQELRVGLGFKGKLKGLVHRWQQALPVNESACEACGKCVSACPEKAISLERVQ